MPQIRKIKAIAVKAPRILEELSGMSCEQIQALMEEKKKNYIIDVDKEIARRMLLLDEQSLVLNKQTELSAAEMLVHFDI